LELGLLSVVNIGIEEKTTIEDFAKMIIAISGKDLSIDHIDGPVGVECRNFSHEAIRELGWTPKYSLLEGIGLTYRWILDQVESSGTPATTGSPSHSE